MTDARRLVAKLWSYCNVLRDAASLEGADSLPLLDGPGVEVDSGSHADGAGRAREPSVAAWELRDGAYVEAGRAVGVEQLRGTSPYDVTVVPEALTG